MTKGSKTGARITDIDSKIGIYIRNQRNLRGISRNELAEKINISHQQIQKYEVGLNRISVNHLIKMRCIFNISREDFWLAIDNNTEVTTNNNTRLKLEIMKLLNGIPRNQQKSISDLLRSMQC